MAKSQVAETLALRDGQIAGLMASLGVSEAHSDTFRLNFTEAEWRQCSQVREAVKYLGFDARQIIAQFFKKAAENPIKPGDLATLKVGDAMLFESCDPKTDLMFFINVFLERGNNVNKAVMRCDGSAGAVLKRKAAAYGIIMEPGQNKNILGSKELTLARLAQAFSIQTATVIIKDQVAGKLRSKLFSVELPLLMQHTIFSGVIPSTGTYQDDLRSIALYLNLEMSLTLSSPKDKRKAAVRTIEELLEQSTQYVDAAITGNMIDDSIRTRILVKAGILESQGATLVLSERVKIMAAEVNMIKRFERQTYQSAVTAIIAERTSEPGTSGRLN